MRSKRIPVILTILFFIFMIIMTITARGIHNRMIPNVTAARLKKEEFLVEHILPDGITKATHTERLQAIPKPLYDSGKVFIIDKAEKNGDIRTFAKAYQIEVGLESENYYEVKNQFYGQSLMFITDTNMDIQDGDEVYVVN